MLALKLCFWNEVGMLTRWVACPAWHFVFDQCAPALANSTGVK
jgi:hypothetical protein